MERAKGENPASSQILVISSFLLIIISVIIRYMSESIVKETIHSV